MLKEQDRRGVCGKRMAKEILMQTICHAEPWIGDSQDRFVLSDFHPQEILSRSFMIREK